MSKNVRATIHVSGLVQGIGYRPFIYRLAINHNLVGSVLNMGDAGVKIEVEGREKCVNQFLIDLVKQKPTLANYIDLHVDISPVKDEFTEFKIEQSSKEVEP